MLACEETPHNEEGHAHKGELKERQCQGIREGMGCAKADLTCLRVDLWIFNR